MVEKIKIPNYRRVRIFADVETCITMDMPNYDYTPTDKTNEQLQEFSTVVPWLMGVSLRPFIGRSDRILHQYKEFTYFMPHEDLFEYMSRVYKTKQIPVVYFHNSSYDLTCLFETAWRDLDPDLEYEMHVKDQNHDFITGRMHSPKYRFKCLFGDTMLYKRISLAEAAKEIGEEKGDIPHGMAEVYFDRVTDILYYIDTKDGESKKYPLSNCLNYCKNDARLCRLYFEYIERVKTNATLTLLGNRPRKDFSDSTQGKHSVSLANHSMRRHYNEDFFDFFRMNITEEEYKLQKLSCCGGFTSFTHAHTEYICKENEIIGSYDVNSMYPFIMAEGLPYGRLTEEKPPGDFVAWLLVEIMEPIKWTGQFEHLSTPPIPIEKLNTKQMYILEELFQFLRPITTGEMRIIKIVYQRKTTILKSYFKDIYDKRVTIKAAKKHPLSPEKLARLEAEDHGLKIAMNCVYGKLCENTHEYSLKYKGGEFIEEENENVAHCAMLSGAYVCWKGRLMIYKHIKQIMEAGFTYLYSDTDSIKFAYPKEEKTKVDEIFGTGGARLGEWKDEGTFHEFSTPARKRYMLINYNEPSKSKIVFSGIYKAKEFAQLMTENLVKNFEETMDHLRLIFNRQHNIKFLLAKTMKIITKKSSQTIIKNTHYHTRPKIKQITAEITLGEEYPGGYLFRYKDAKK